MIRQEAFDKVYKHFILDKGLPSFVAKGEKDDILCRYKMNPDEEDSPRCAVGIFLENYRVSLEESFLLDLIGKNLIPTFTDAKYSLSFWCKIQRCHDYAAKDPDFHIRMEALN